MAPLLPPAPPLGIAPCAFGFIKWIHRGEGNSPMLTGIVGNSGEIPRVLIAVPNQKIAAAVSCTGRIVIAAHPPHGRVGEQFKSCDAPVSGPFEHGALCRISVPIPTARRGV